MTFATLLSAGDPNTLFLLMSMFLFVFGFGVGGEYPLSASSANERAMELTKEKMDAAEEAGEERRREARKREAEERRASLESEATSETSPRSILRTSSYIAPMHGTGGKDDDVSGTFDGQSRGKRVLLVFAMQGVGIFLNALMLTLLLLVTGQTRGDYDPPTLLAIWRIIYALGAATLVYVLVSRIKYLEESVVWSEDRERGADLIREKEMIWSGWGGGLMSWDGLFPPALSSPLTPTAESDGGAFPAVALMRTVSSMSAPHDVDPFIPEYLDACRRNPSTDGDEDRSSSALALLIRNYGVRLAGTSVSWLLWDVAFYGNKLFQSSFLLSLTGEDTSLLQLSVAAALNAFVALLGYFAAAFIVDDPRVGRVRLQQWGLLIVGTLFVLCGFLRENLGSRWLVAMYLGSSFFGQCGPNATTFLIPAGE